MKTQTKIIVADVLTGLARLEDQSVHCVITSPPYWNQRDYQINGQIGLEPTPVEYVTKLVKVFREVWRVLRDDGTVWLNLGDSYAGSGKAGKKINMKPKDLIGLPWRVAFALQADGWYLRSDIIWSKSNSKPESCVDRPTNAHEHVFLLAKRARYFYDNEAIKEPYARKYQDGPGFGGFANKKNSKYRIIDNQGNGPNAKVGSGCNKRSVWSIPTVPFPKAHFATYPPGLVEPCIKAGTSERGVCPKCGNPWRRMVETNRSYTPVDPTTLKGEIRSSKMKLYRSNSKETGEIEGQIETVTIGWQPSCSCGLDPIPATVLDPFFGAGTTGLVTTKLRRNCIGVEISPKYAKMAKKRIDRECGLLAEKTELIYARRIL